MSNEDYEFVPRADAPPQIEALLEGLRPLVTVKLFKCVEKVVDDYKQKIPNDTDNLKNLITALITDSNNKPSHCSSSWYNSFSSKKVKVYPVVASKTFGAHEEILKKVKVEVCADPSDCDVVLVFCPVTSRVGSDVDDAMRNISGEASMKKVILVVMHHSRKDISRSEAQLNHGHQNVISDVHVVFHQTVNGLLKCKTNDQAIQCLQDMFKHFQT